MILWVWFGSEQRKWARRQEWGVGFSQIWQKSVKKIYISARLTSEDALYL